MFSITRATHYQDVVQKIFQLFGIRPKIAYSDDGDRITIRYDDLLKKLLQARR